MPLILIAPPTQPPITVAEMKFHLRDDEDDDSEVLAKMMAATTLAESRMRRSIMPQQWMITLDLFPPGAIRLARPPLISVDEIAYIQASDGQEVLVASSDYIIDRISPPGWVMLGFQKAWPTDTVLQVGNAVKILFTTGYQDATLIPTPIIEWIKLATGDLYSNRERSSEKPVLKNDFADELIAPYRIPNLGADLAKGRPVMPSNPSGHWWGWG